VDWSPLGLSIAPKHTKAATPQVACTLHCWHEIRTGKL